MFSLGKAALGLATASMLAGVIVGAGPASAKEAGPDGRLYGSIAILEYDNDTEDWNAAYNYPSWDEADRDALNDCGDPTYCHIAVRFADGCGAVAKTSGSNARYFWGTAPTRFEAERQALAGAFRPSSMSAAGGPGILVVSKCTGNAG